MPKKIRLIARLDVKDTNLVKGIHSRDCASWATRMRLPKNIMRPG